VRQSTKFKPLRPRKGRRKGRKWKLPPTALWASLGVVAVALGWIFWHYTRSHPAPPNNTVGVPRPGELTPTQVLPGPLVTGVPPVIRVTPTNVLVTRPAITSAPPVSSIPPRPLVEPGESGFTMRPVQNVLEAQLALARQGISSGPLDGVPGSQTRLALRAYQTRERLPVTGELDLATKASLLLTAPVFTNYQVTTEDLTRLRPLAMTWLGKSSQDRLDYESILELVAERGAAHSNFIRRLNPGVDWTNIVAGTELKLPATAPPPPRGRVSFLRISLGDKTLQAFDANTNLLAHFPCSIARRVEKRPIGELRVAVVAPNPNYTFDPDVFPESEEGRQLKRKLVLPPGPNNPVGTAWIGLDRPGYGIHGTPLPEQVGRTESHGCFRLANWNAEWLVRRVGPGTPVYVEP
jgi:lipoprotein-anchoring transpeptidase ErfK/SrfK